MPLNQYVYLGLWSNEVTADQVTSLLGVEPDERIVRGSRRSDPPLPVSHSWQLVCRDPDLRIDEQAAKVLERIRPIANPVHELTTTGKVTACLQLVRYFDDETAPPAPVVEIWGEDGPEMLPDPSHLLSFHFPAGWLRLLEHIGASINCDEYSLR